MVLNEFPDLIWLKRQISSRFENRAGWNGRILKEQGWPTVLLNVKTSGISRDNIKGPFSLFGNLKGSSFVKVDTRKVKVSEDHFFITNSGQNYSLEIDDKSKTETFNIHFGDQFADQLIHSQSSSVEKIMEERFQTPIHSFSFHNRLIRKTKEINELLLELQSNKDELKEEELLSHLFIELFREELKLTHATKALPSIRESTRSELVKRILLSTDYIHEFYNQQLTLGELANTSCLSKFHFLRLFKIATGQTPHQFITKVRIEKSKELLNNSNEEIKQIADIVGFSDSSSFSRAFHQHVGAYPSQFRGLT
ncbi:MAG: helix-turn-helix transcriptional regulator [Bacteroidetes bacterium]|nr:helix-turn-helix transcriptional regulator [Bacteroidota bacterium]MBI3482481.1 helix-turn-helix transcriptional regulator [Bacteroidota bacterium]